MSLFSRLFDRKPARDSADEWERSYRAWADAQVCVDCGRSARDEPKEFDADGNCVKTWMTETQCVPCFEVFGSAERRGMVSAQDKYLAEVMQ